MPDIKITNLPLGTEIADDDELLYIDTSDTTAGPDGTDKRVLIGSLRNIANRSMTTVELINNSLNMVEGESITTNGFYEDGDGGGAQWVLTGDTGTASQTPADLGDAKFTDGDGRVWELVIKNGSLDVDSLGADRYGDNDSSGAFKAAWAAAYNESFYYPSQFSAYEITFGSGRYLILDGVNSTTDTTNRDVRISIRGNGQEQTLILVGGNTHLVNWVKTNYGQYFQLKNMSVYAYYGSNSSETTFTPQPCPIVLSQATQGNRRERHHIIEGVNFGSYNRSIDYFDGYIDIKGGGRALIREVKGWGVFTENREDSWLATFGYRLIDHYGPNIERVGAWCTDTSFHYAATEDPGPEGGEFVDVTGDSRVGLYVYCPSVIGEPGLKVHGDSHFNYGDYGIEVVNRRYITIENVLFYNEFEDRVAADIKLNNVSYSKFSNNIAGYPGNISRSFVSMEGGLTGSIDNTFQGNSIVGSITGFIFSDLTCEYNFVTGTKFSSSGSSIKYIDNGLNNQFESLGDKSSMVYLTADQTITNATLTLVNFNQVYDSTSEFTYDETNSRFVINNNEGVNKVKIKVNLVFQASSSGTRVARLLKNGADFIGSCGVNTPSGSGATEINISTGNISVEDGDRFSLVVQQDSGGDLLVKSSNRTWFSIEKV